MRRPAAKTRGALCRVYPVLLFLCYLEVLLWTSCLLLSCAPVSAGESVDSQNYLLREKGNLGFAACGNKLAASKGFAASPFQIPLHLLHYHVKAIWAGLNRELQESLILVNSDLLQPALTSLRIIEGVSGIPAPYSGIKAIS